MSVLPIPPKVYRPRCVVIVGAQLDDQIPASPGVPATWQSIPRKVSWQRNSARKADTATVELDMRDFPLDPRMLKGLLVTIHVEDALDPDLPMVATPLNKRFVGLVDSPESKLNNEGDIVTFDCRDFTGIWLDTKLLAQSVISLTQPLSAIVEQLRVLVTPLILPAIFTDPAAAAFVPGVTKGKVNMTVGKDESAWDLLSRLLQLYGLLPVFDLDVLTIRTASRVGLNKRILTYGQNVTSLTFKRNLTREPKSRRITVHAWNPVLGVPVVGFFQPPEARIKLNTKGPPKFKVTEVAYNVIGNYNVAELSLIAKRIYDEQATQQVEGTVETREMVDGFLPLGRPLLGLANGDTLTIRLGRDLMSTIQGMSPPEAAAFLSNPVRPNSLNPLAAAALVQAWTTAGVLAVTFYVRDADHSWSADEGYTMSATFINFLIGQGV